MKARVFLISLCLLSGIGYGATGWVVGERNNGHGTIFKTEDGGKTWIRQTNGVPDVDLGSVSAIDKFTVWVAGNSVDGHGTILKTEDGGRTWVRQTNGVPDVELTKIRAVDRNNVWAVGYHGVVLKTEDGGKMWERVGADVLPDVQLQGLCVVNKNDVWVGGEEYQDYGTIYHTIDGGKTWKREGKFEDLTGVYIIGMYSLNCSTAWSVGHKTTIFKTENGGINWVLQFSGTGFMDANEVFASDRYNVWVVADNGLIIHTEDGGKTWSEKNVFGEAYLMGIDGTDKNNLWIVGIYYAGGVILHTSDGGENWVDQTPQGITGLMDVSFAPENYVVSTSGCFIATASYGTPMAKEVRILCKFRDEFLLKNSVGRVFVKIYYRVSPSVADFIRNKPVLRKIVRIGLKPLICFCKWKMER